jgi:hypothetical protein
VKGVTFLSKLFGLKEYIFYLISGKFENIPYEIINIKDTTYINKSKNNITSNSELNKTIVHDVMQMEGLNNKLAQYIEDKINDIEFKQQRVLRDIKNALKNELAENKKLFEKLKTFQT